MSTTKAAYSNKRLPKKARFARALETTIGLPLNILEFVGSYVIVRPWNGILRGLDGLSYKLEGTWLRTFLSHAIFPFTLVVSMIIGFRLAEEGATFESASLILGVLAVIGVYAAVLERLMPFSRNWLEGENDMSVDFMMIVSAAFWNGFAAYLLGLLLITQLAEFLEPYGHGLWPSELPALVQVFLYVLIKDFFRYWFHRALHEVPFLWRFHAAHHSVKRLYWLNGFRVHPMEVVAQAFLYALPFALLQPSPEIVMVSIMLQLSVSIFQHTNVDLKLGFWEYIFSIGDNHRYHHYPNKEVGDSNYGGEFILWDILFGTFYKVSGQRPSDVIGIGTAPNYPMTMAGQMIAPFIPDQKVFGPEAGEEALQPVAAQPAE